MRLLLFFSKLCSIGTLGKNMSKKGQKSEKKGHFRHISEVLFSRLSFKYTFLYDFTYFVQTLYTNFGLFSENKCFVLKMCKINWWSLLLEFCVSEMLKKAQKWWKLWFLMKTVPVFYSVFDAHFVYTFTTIPFNRLYIFVHTLYTLLHTMFFVMIFEVFLCCFSLFF